MLWPRMVLTVLATAAAISGCRNKANFFANGWSLPLPPSRFRHDGLSSARNLLAPSSASNSPPICSNSKRRGLSHARRTPQSNTHRSSHLAKALHVRGGGGTADEVGDKADQDAVEDIASESGEEETVDDSSGDAEGENAMKELRKEWSSIPAVPTIALPITDNMRGDDHTESTLADFDNGITPQTASIDQPRKGIIIMDGFSPYHGQYLSHMARQVYGATVIHVLSDFFARYLYQVEQQTDHLSSRMPDLERGEDVEAWTSALPPSLEICGIYCESDSGLEDAERLGVALGLHPRCHDGVNRARRDKFLMNQAVSEVGGLDVVKQKSCRTLEEAEEFARGSGLGEVDEGTEPSTLVVVKPLRGVASDDVHLCSDLPSLRKAFSKILQSPVFGSSTAAKHERVLVQEFATGVEYAADVVCRDGERKVAALWRYDKRPVNGAPFVYHATELVSAHEEGAEKEACDYIFDALEALGVRWGLSHVEVIAETLPETGRMRVRLVEVNCRQHNTDFMPLCNACVGYNSLDMVLAAHLGNDGEDSADHGRGLPWDSIPVLPTTRAYGAIVHFVSHVEGKISRIRYDVLEAMEDLASVVDMHVYPRFMELGNPIQKTIDIRSDTGWAHLMNDVEEEFRRDYSRLVDLMKDMFEVKED